MRRTVGLAVVVVLAQVALALPLASVAAADDPPAEAEVWEPSEAPNTALLGGDPTLTAAVTAQPEGISDLHVELPPIDASSSQTSTTTRLADGSYVTELFAGPVNYLDAAGVWRSIDTTLVASDEPGYAWRNAAGEHEVQLPADLAGAPVRMAAAGGAVAFALADAASSLPRVEGSSAVYPAAQPGVDVVYTATNSGVKEELVLASADAPSRFLFDVTPSPGLGLRAARDGGVDVVDALGGEVFSFAAPFMVDSAEDGGALSEAVTLRIVATLPTVVVELVADRAWLAAPERVWPVRVDPTVNLSKPLADAQITSGTGQNSNFATASTMKVGYDATNVNRALLDFSVPPVLREAGATVRSALLSATVMSQEPVGASAFDVRAHELTEAFTESAVTWVKRTSSANWATAGGTFASTIESTQRVGATNAAERTWHVTGAVQRPLAAGKTRLGLLLRAANETTTNVVRIASREAAESVTWPKLTVHWEPALGLAGKYTFETFELGETRTAHVNVANGNLVLHERDALVRGTGLDATVERFYNSRSVYAHDFGNRWQAVPQTAARLYPQPNGDMVYYRDTVEVYRRITATRFESPSGANKTLTRGSTSGPFTLTHHADGNKEEFHPNGYVKAIRDRNGNTITITYDQTTNQVVSMRDTQGRTFEFARNERNRVHTMTDPLGRTHRYRFAPNTSELTRYTDPQGGHTDYGYDKGDLVSVNDADNTRTEFTYDASDRVTSVRLATNDPAGPRTWQFAYLAGSTRITDPRGNVTTYRYDPQARVEKVIDALGRERSTAYNANSNVISYTDEVGATPTASTYDGRNNLTKTTQPTGATSTFAYASTAHPFYPTGYTSPQGNALTYAYDTPGNLATVTDPSAGTTRLAYNANGTIASSTDPNGKVTRYVYDTAGNRTRVVPPAPMGETRYTYDTASRVTSARDGNGHTTRYAYDIRDRVTKVTAHDGSTVVYAYNPVGKRTTQTDTIGQVQRTTVTVFNRFGEVVEERLPGRRTNRYTYDAIGNLASHADAGGTITYAHNAVNLLTTLTEPDGQRTTYDYDARNNPRFTRYPNGVVQEGTFDASNRLETITGRNAAGTVLTRFAYDYKRSGSDTGLRHSVTDHTDAITTYGYDGLDRLTSAVTRNTAGTVLKNLGYGYDAASNRTRETIDGTTVTATFNDANQLTARGSTTYTYDGAGQQTGSSAGAQLGYNTLRQTTSMRRAGGTAITATYSGADQRRRETAAGETFTTTLLGVTVKLPPSGTTAVTQHYVRDDAGGLVGVRETGTGAKRGYYLFDGLGSVAAITHATTAAVLNRYTYDPYGVTSEQRLSGAITNPWRYTGELQDTATGLYKIGARYLDTTLGRWTQRDPIGPRVNMLEVGESSAYAYVGADPINRSDPSGCATLSGCVIDCLGGAANLIVNVTCVSICRTCAILVATYNPFCWGCAACAGWVAVQCVRACRF